MTDLFVIGVMPHGPGRLAAKQVRFERGIGQPQPQPFLEPGTNIANLVQLLPQPGVFQFFRVGAGFQRRTRIFLVVIHRQQLEHGLGGEHRRFHRGMGALDFRHVEEARGVTHQQPAGKGQFRDRLQPALGYRTRAVGDPGAALEERPDRRMILESLKLFERAQMWIAVIEADNKSDGDLVVFVMVEKRSAVGIRLQWPADSVQRGALVVHLGSDFPDFLDTDAVGLRLDAIAQAELLHQLASQRAAAALGKNGLATDQFDPRLEVLARLAILADAHVAGGDTAHRARVVVQHFGRGEAREDFDAQLFGLLREPAAQVAEADNIVALVVHLRRGRHRDRSLLGQELERIRFHRHVQRRSFLFPVGNQLA